MGLTAFNRMRRVRGSALAGLKAEDVPAAGMNITETIVEHLKRQHIPHSLAEARGMAQEFKRKIRDSERGVETDQQSSEPGTGPGGLILNVAETLADAAKREGAPSSVVVAGGRVVATHEEDEEVVNERLAQFSSGHFAPQTSVHEGTDGRVPPLREDLEEPPPTSSDPENDTTNRVNPRALGAESRRDEQDSEEEKRSAQADKEARQRAEEQREHEEEEEEQRERLSSATARAADRGEAPGRKAVEAGLRARDKTMIAQTQEQIGGKRLRSSSEPVISESEVAARESAARSEVQAAEATRQENIARRGAQRPEGVVEREEEQAAANEQEQKRAAKAAKKAARKRAAPKRGRGR